MKPPFSLAPDAISTDTTTAIRQLLDMAERGDLIGIAFAAMQRQRRYFVNTAGEAHRNPGFARSCISVLDDELGRRMRSD
jgi:hypothetical protein